MSITSGLAPIRNYANGGDINTKRQNMLAKLGFPSGMTNEDLDAAIAEEAVSYTHLTLPTNREV